MKRVRFDYIFFIGLILIYSIFSLVGYFLYNNLDLSMLNSLLFITIFIVYLKKEIPRYSLEIYPNRIYFFENYSTKIITIYYLVLIIKLIIVGNFSNLYQPPTPSTDELVFNRINRHESFLIIILDYIILLIQPFFLVSISTLKKGTHIVLILLLSVYLEFLINEYISRGTILQTLLILLYINHQKNILSNRILYLLFPLIIYFLVLFFFNYQFLRIGSEYRGSISFGRALEFMLFQQIDFVVLLDSVVDKFVLSFDRIKNYVIWILTLPFPSFITNFFYYENFRITSEISELLHGGLERNNPNFYIVLIGFYGESYFLFGKYMFWLHAIITAKILNFYLRIFKTYSGILTVFILVKIVYSLPRAGVASVFPILFANFLLFMIFHFTGKFKISN